MLFENSLSFRFFPAFFRKNTGISWFKRGFSEGVYDRYSVPLPTEMTMTFKTASMTWQKYLRGSNGR
jgi:hypothetical protein